jgi:hypothetical protein
MISATKTTKSLLIITPWCQFDKQRSLVAKQRLQQHPSPSLGNIVKIRKTGIDGPGVQPRQMGWSAWLSSSEKSSNKA